MPQSQVTLNLYDLFNYQLTSGMLLVILAASILIVIIVYAYSYHSTVHVML